MHMNRVAFGVLSAAFVLLGPAMAGAQRGRGSTLVATVAVEGSQQLLPGAEVVVTDLQRSSRSDIVGEADITDVSPGTHVVRVRAFGYVAAEAPILFNRDTVAATFYLKPLVVSMDIVHVSATQVPHGLEQFAARRAMAIGHFLTWSQLDSASTSDFQTLVTIKFPGLTVISLANGDRAIASLGGAGHWGVSPCFVPVILDGQPVHDAISDIVRTWDLAGVEFYTGAETPVEYRIPGYGCGVLVLWSRNRVRMK
jgi:hypothetical protein